MSTISRHTLTARLGSTKLLPKDGTITLDEGWSPYVQARLTIATPDSLDSIDPRQKIRVQIDVQQDFGDSDTVAAFTTLWHGKRLSDLSTAYHGMRLSGITAQHYRPWNSFGVRSSTRRSLNLLLRSRRRGLVDDTTELTLASDEALLQDYGLVSNVPYVPAETSLRTIVKYVLGLIGGVLDADAGADATIAAGASTWLPGVSAWAYLAPLVQAGALRLWCDEGRHWHLTTDAITVGGSVALTTTGTIVEHSDTIDRDGEWYDAVVIEYRWVDATGAQQTAFDSAAADGFSKVQHVTYDTQYPGPGAAARVLARALGRGRVQDVTAVSDYLVTPGQPASITTPDVGVESGFVSAVSWAFPADEMTVKTRGLVDTPDDAWVFDDDTSWAASDDTTWAGW